MDGAVKGHRFRVIIRIRVEYEQYFIYGRADRKVNNARIFEQSALFRWYHAWTAEINCRATDRHTHKTTTVTLLRMRRGLIMFTVLNR